MVVVVEIENQSISKPFLGGWRHVVTKVEYHNASTQTLRKASRSALKRLRTRITQTTLEKFTQDLGQQKGVQVSEESAHFPSAGDKILAPKNPRRFAGTDVEEFLIREESAIKIQRFFRSRRARMAIEKLLRTVHEILQPSSLFMKKFPMHYYDKLFHVIKTREPRSRSDFETIHNLLDRWRITEVERANRELFAGARLAAHGLILLREVKVIRALDDIKTRLKREKDETERSRFLEQLATSERWKGSGGRVLLVDTPRVLRAKEYKELHDSLKRKDLSSEERLSLLESIEGIAEVHSCRTSRELGYLIEQEKLLLAHGVSTATMDQMRNRLRIAYLHLVHGLRCWVESPDFRDDRSEAISPGGSRFPHKGGRPIFYENASRRSFPGPDCRSRSTARPREAVTVIHAPYQKMLQDLRRSEARSKCYTSLAFLIDAKLVHQLVNVVWHGKSGISECRDLDQLRLVKFWWNSDWAPWNSLLLTRREAAMHKAITDPTRIYSASLVQRFTYKNLQAKLHYESIMGLQRRLKSSLREEESKSDDKDQ
ncbi:IQ and ubiquitin-like domain-containing protein [Orussus abietinus]|uniref:IQ and ubiquitin-like domain-containing protein n=1 Tax=Orussus abietinus TaxID=222816 RepID=UPI000625ABA8|nr:IQ and ubiquitin-like domain-containing protein [Orussus abietinus]